MKSRVIRHLLILLAISAQVDDYVALEPVFTFVQLAATEDNEYLPEQSQRNRERSLVQLEPVFVGLEFRAGDLLISRGDADPPVAVPFSPPQLYVFMSLQC